MYEGKLLDKILNRDNLNLAFKQVEKNKGAAGIDGMTVDELGAYMALNKDEIILQIRQRKYQPSPVLRVEIPKPNGGVRLLGIPTVKDRVIQQAIAQVLTPIFDRQFSEYSYGFRPRRYAEMAILQALEFLNEGHDWIVDIDLERFFDTVNHDRLMNLVSKTVDDGDVISLIRKFLVSGVQIDEDYEETVIGTPQGGNLSPLLSNIMLNELDMELERRGLRFVRYADDCIIMVKSEMAARRVMRSVTRFIEEKLGLIVNASKTKVTRPNDPSMKFLGFGFFKDYQMDLYKAKPHQKSVENFKFKLKQLTRKNWSVDTKYQVERVNQVIRGWINYFKIGYMKKLLGTIDSHTRVRLRMCIWKKWKTAKNRRKNLIKLGMNKYNAYKYSHTSKGIVRIAYSWVLTTTITNKRLAQFGLISCVEHYNKVHA
ncbi:group II intron reverse transcriptase/maturase [Fredinandcohnia sp. QZ13]|uniref:group II intron reverse transcriptase/maturase n=1 Tax=Fredinandcohnia sp. QZ13 TaxID=3073144 RepID=UPI0028535355|nr:group II intron reverse transcriptase/maturase [Fredinandcohnia sp. QZ13]MDR4885930.1 group II intron reverse transcriptase/maturase [Fredinandcohnia sp. QZ13]MDR4889316.1 group II intron reverse transcriptase/maturase [Fredinandcohnia sp. QZ13]MDR4890139.1 group II intron reverse transcriptase/maturase [Fredinandcohnia sp. QZ13]MDR4890308.1 group II intron reverse transcriptase/maturase [Fredinandcohnia sp. QZ13]